MTNIGYTFLGSKNSLGKVYDVYQNGTTGDEITVARLDNTTGTIEYVSSLKGDGEIEYENIDHLRKILVPEKLKDILTVTKQPKTPISDAQIHPAWKEFFKPDYELPTVNHIAAGLFSIYGSTIPTKAQVRKFWKANTSFTTRLIYTFYYDDIMREYKNLLTGLPPDRIGTLSKQFTNDMHNVASTWIKEVHEALTNAGCRYIDNEKGYNEHYSTEYMYVLPDRDRRILPNGKPLSFTIEFFNKTPAIVFRIGKNEAERRIPIIDTFETKKKIKSLVNSIT